MATAVEMAPAEQNMTPVERNLRAILLTKVYDNDKVLLESKIREQMKDGAGNTVSALRKLTRVDGRKELPEPVTVMGYFLQRYHRQPRETDSGNEEDRGWSVYLATPKGISTIRTMDPKTELPAITKESIAAGGPTMKSFGEMQTWDGLKQVNNVIFDNITLHVTKGKTTVKKADSVGKDLWDLSKPITQIETGFSNWRGYISVVFPVGIFDQETRKRTGYQQILGDGGRAALSIGITDVVDPKTGRGETRTFVELTSDDQLHTLLGALYDEAMLLDNPEKAARELRDMLVGQPVIVVGQGKTPHDKNTPEKYRVSKPKITCDWGRGLVAPWSPPKSG